MTHQPATPAPLEPGSTLAGYQINRLLGRGSAAEVYRASRIETGEEFALKLLHIRASDQTLARHRFEREMAVVARLDHPGISHIHEFGGVSPGTYYIVMDLIDGASLRDVLSERRDGLPLPKALDIFQQLAEALTYAHTQGVIHQDVRPSNILLANGVRPILVDFGLVRLLDQDDITTAQFSPRAPLYMSPEQAAGREITPRADIYALGILLYEMTTGDVPFKGGSAARVLVQHLQAAPRPPSELKGDLDSRVEAVILKALSKEPHERYASPLVMLDDLTDAPQADSYDTVTLTRNEAAAFRQELNAARAQYQPQAASSAPPPSAPEPSAPPGLDRRLLLIGGVVLVVVVVVLAILILQGMG